MTESEVPVPPLAPPPPPPPQPPPTPPARPIPPTRVQRFVPSQGGEDVAPDGIEPASTGVQRFLPPRGGKNVAPDEATRRIREFAEQQHGVVSWRQLTELGV